MSAAGKCVNIISDDGRKMCFISLPQLIFRKVSDVLKEQELAERRKNDPVLNHTQDHLVRKLFNKFKKNDGGGGPTGGGVVVPGTEKIDVEKGEQPSAILSPNGE